MLYLIPSFVLLAILLIAPVLWHFYDIKKYGKYNGEPVVDLGPDDIYLRHEHYNRYDGTQYGDRR